jgi:hypothetical protein
VWKVEPAAYLAVVAVNKQGMVPPVQNHAQNRLHRREGNILFLRPLHVEDDVFDAIPVEERIIALRKVLAHQGAAD